MHTSNYELAANITAGWEYNLARTSDVLRQNFVSHFVVNGKHVHQRTN